MPTQRLSTRRIREVLRLRHQDLTESVIARTLGVSNGVVHELWRRLITTPRCRLRSGADYRATVDVPAQFRKSKSVRVFGLTCSRYQSGEIDWSDKNIALWR